ncbi:formyltransferase family protein [Methylobacterium haplocladii]|uniref:Methionyl-tRNA formyltransferase n=1 Tax=Methylobacterium haplocladii TaxID=1176176 RepID=A0A512IS30_9HYPH|nr:formyltransferase family protein [Methylobacterium haplocladii]GEP00517.1 methionyl-tRNA formyltransferase [Methylobacterium haplocladii]GJD85432.1 Methionyl-tRNA formyltransferase [Methylobacterium haplocladii]GLS57817.1 methionyl-tRNA formyltransferase [Methylobacterium haplocladii]
MKIYISGQKMFGADVFRLVQRLGHTIAGVSSPAFDGTGQREDKLRAAAGLAGVPWLESGRLDAHTLPEGVDLILAAHSHEFIGRKTRMRARFGALGYHPSLLPRHRGRDAIRWTLAMGDAVTGGTVFWLSERVDGGDIAAQDFVFVETGENPADLWRGKLAPLGLRLIEAALWDLNVGIMRRQPQDEAVATWEPSFGRPPLSRPDLELLGYAPGLTVSRAAARAA